MGYETASVAQSCDVNTQRKGRSFPLTDKTWILTSLQKHNECFSQNRSQRISFFSGPVSPSGFFWVTAGLVFLDPGGCQVATGNASEVKRQQLREHGKIQLLNVWFGGEKGQKNNKTTKHNSQHLQEALKAQEKRLSMPMAPTFLFLRNSI